MELPLTTREEEIFLLLRDKNTDEISKALGLHKHFVTQQITNIQRKLHLPSHKAVQEYARVRK